MPYTRLEFESAFPSLLDDLTKNAEQYELPSQALEWYRKSLTYNTLGGKYNRGISVLDTVSILTSTNSLPDAQFRDAATLGWLTELLQAFFLVSDDIMDSSLTRRGQPCWYRVPSVGTIAVNDAFMLEASIYTLLKIHFRQHPSYVDFFELFHSITFQTEIGQLCDLITAPEDHVDLANFSMAKFTFIVIYKTAYYSFYLPVALALHYLSLATPRNLAQARAILIPLGEYFQAQDDYLDAFGSPEIIGKVGTDIQDNKCSWLINQALVLANITQRTVLEEYYGRKDAQAESRVKDVYKELKLDQVYHTYEEKKVQEIQELIAQVDEAEGLRKEVFQSFLSKIYRRTK